MSDKSHIAMYNIPENEYLVNNPLTLEQLLMERYEIERELNAIDLNDFHMFPRFQYLQDALRDVSDAINAF
mgnify:CR=1 FL=1